MKHIAGNDSGVTGIEVRTKTDKDPVALEVDGVFIYQNGSKPITDFVGDQVTYNPDGGVQVDAIMATSVEGVWAVGDIRNTPFKQAVVAAADGCVAAMAIDRFLNSRKGIRPDWEHG